MKVEALVDLALTTLALLLFIGCGVMMVLLFAESIDRWPGALG